MIKTIKSLSLLSMGSLISSGSTFLIFTILARQIGPAAFGIFSSALATTKIFSLISGFGIAQVWLKLFGKEGWGGIRWVKPSLYFVLISIIFVSLVILFLNLFNFNDDTTKNLLLLFIFFIYGNVSVQLISSKLQLEEKYNQVAFWQLLPNLSRLILVVAGFYLFDISLSVIDIGIIYAFIGMVLTIIGVKQLFNMGRGRFELKGHGLKRNIKELKPTIKEVVSEAWPFGMATIFAFIYIQSDIIMVKYMSGDIEAGYYNVSYVVLSALLIIPTILFSKFLMPKYHRWANYSREKFYRAYKLGNLTMILAGFSIMLILLFFSHIFISIIFGEEYESSIQLMKILSLTLPISFVAYSLGATLVTKQHMKLKVLLMGTVAIFNIVLNIFLISYYDAMGAAIATVISNLLLLTLYYFAVKKRVFRKTLKE
ncbi:flippase [Croceitalea rosinachiae]|uniref:Flippase n=1 Tax=Croceitalea rosinachiae TaxID=3075596 RepID=A0ABU3A7T8_9FLAO|nr:flippase [Croceitalea sp. F388]MDT0606248.1 flippase [Croceitalea sp. F388]